MKTLSEGERKETDLVHGHTLVQEVKFGLHSLAVHKMGVEKAKVYVRDYPHWEAAFDKVMDKAGI